MSEPKNCLVCGEPIPRRAYQASWVRTCGPVCASDLAHRENPDLDRRRRGLVCEATLPACAGCDGHGFYMVNAHGPQEVKCGECCGTGISGYGSPETAR